MRKRKIHPASYQAFAEAQIQTKGAIKPDLAKMWRGDEDIELEPKIVSQLSNSNG
jgi:hypothetical protein